MVLKSCTAYSDYESRYYTPKAFLNREKKIDITLDFGEDGLGIQISVLSLAICGRSRLVINFHWSFTFEGFDLSGILRSCARVTCHPCLDDLDMLQFNTTAALDWINPETLDLSSFRII